MEMNENKENSYFLFAPWDADELVSYFWQTALRMFLDGSLPPHPR